MSLKEIAQLKPPGQNQAVKIRITRIWDCYIPTSEKFLGIAFIATDAKVFIIYYLIKFCKYYLHLFPLEIIFIKMSFLG